MTYLEIKRTGEFTHEIKGAAAVLNEPIDRGDLLGETDWFHTHRADGGYCYSGDSRRDGSALLSHVPTEGVRF